MTNPFGRTMVLLVLGLWGWGLHLWGEDFPYGELNPEIPRDYQPLLQGPTPAEADEQAAERFYVRGRSEELSGHFSEAIRSYQRAWRLSPSESILFNIVSLTVREKRGEEMARYFSKVVHAQKLEVLTLRNVGLTLTLQNEIPEAIRAYEATLAGISAESFPALRVLLRHELGRLYYLEGDYPQAIFCFEFVRRALRTPRRFELDEEMVRNLREDESLLLYLLTDSYLMEGDAEKASEALREAVESEKSQMTQGKEGGFHVSQTPEEIEVRANFYRARIAAKSEQWEEGKIFLEKAFGEKIRGEGAAPYELYRDILAALGKSRELRQSLETWYEKDPENADLGYFLADVCLKEEKYDRAEELLEDWTSSQPTTESYTSLLELTVRENSPERFLHSVYKILSQQETEGSVHAAWKGVQERFAEENREEDGERFLREVFAFSRKHYPRTEPLPWQFFWSLAWVATEVGEEEAAEEFYQAAENQLKTPFSEQNRPGILFFVERGSTLLLAERWDEAESLFQTGMQVVEKPEERGLLAFYLSNGRAMKKDFEGARKVVEQGLKEDKESILLAKQLGWIAYLSGDLEGAAQTYEKILKQYGEQYTLPHLREELREVRLTLSAVEAYRQHFAQAEELLEEVLDEFPDDVGAKNDLAYLWATQSKNLHRAIRMAEEAVAEEAENHAYWDTLGWIQYLRGDFEAARTSLERSLEWDADPVVYRHLMEVYEVLGNPEKGVEMGEKSLATFQEYREKGHLVDEKEETWVRERLQSLRKKKMANPGSAGSE
ncbi:MAG: tetratricopeptide repeat protein [Planctomycetia bacterium]|nr:tetratricopeptide repeat protein [Planctomycetia bacterium]